MFLIILPALLLWFWPEGRVADLPFLADALQLVGKVTPNVEKISSASEYPEASKVGFTASWLLMPIVILHMLHTSTIFGVLWDRKKTSSVLRRMGFIKKTIALLFLILVVFSIYKFEPSIASSTRFGRFLSHAYTENRLLSGFMASMLVFVVPLFSIAIGMYLKAIISKLLTK